MKGFSAERYEALFDRACDGVEGAGNELRSDETGRYRCKTIKAGDQLECEIYPIWNTQTEAKKAKKAITREAQKAQNEKNARKRLIRRINANFGPGDIELTLTYDEDHIPVLEEARRDMQNYIRRVKRLRKAQGLPEMKYVYVIEYAGEDGAPKRVHHHIIMSGMDRDAAEKLWGKGRANSARLQPDEKGLEGLARYITKSLPRFKSEKRWCCSKNLIEPTVTVADTKITRRKAARLAHDADAYGKDLFEHLYPGYTYTDIEIKYSPYVAGVYIYTRMRRNHGSPGRHKLAR